MKKSILIILTILSFSSFNTKEGNSAFCEGWEDGYVDGWCYEVPHCLDPLVPLCPLPRINEDGYKGGYNRGFLQGLKDRD